MPVARIVWLAMLASTGIYWLVLTVLLSEPAATMASPELLHTLWIAFGGLAVVSTVVVSVLRRSLPSPDGAGLARWIVCWAIAESIALYGLVFGLLSRDGAGSTPFFVGAAILLVMLRPPAPTPAR